MYLKEVLTSWYFTTAASVSSNKWYTFPKKANAVKCRGSISITLWYTSRASSRRLNVRTIAKKRLIIIIQKEKQIQDKEIQKSCLPSFLQCSTQINIRRSPCILRSLCDLGQIDRSLKELHGLLEPTIPPKNPQRVSHPKILFRTGDLLSAVDS